MLDCTSSSLAGPRARVAFYGDDFTGSVDALVQYHRFGLRGLLLVGRPDADLIAAVARDYDVVGVAGVARSLAPADMAAEVRPVLAALRRIGPRVVQYKMCSTADSSPRLGSLGAAIELGREVFGPHAVPFLAAQPELGRYTFFGHHFAAEAGQVYRLDRQPTMSRHPATPMPESDLRLHLAAQTSLPVGSVDITDYELPPDLAADRYAAVLARRPGAVVFDAVYPRHLRSAAALMLGARTDGTLFALGSGGLSFGIAAALTDRDEPAPPPAGPVRDTVPIQDTVPGRDTAPVLAVSGSCAPQTARQIRRARAAGWTGLAIDMHAWHADPAGYPAALADRVVDAVKATRRGVVVHSAPDRPGTGTGTGTATGTGIGTGPAIGDPRLVSEIGSLLGGLISETLRRTDVRRVIVAGGDTSGRVMRMVGADAIEIEAVLDAGVALCRVRARDSRADGLRLVLKGGQVGAADLFEAVRLGGTGRRES